MDKKENKRDKNSSSYFKYRSKKNKKAGLFSPTSINTFKNNHIDGVQKHTPKSNQMIRSNRICYELTHQKENLEKSPCPQPFSLQKQIYSPFKYIQEQNKPNKQFLKNSQSWKRQKTLRYSRQRKPHQNFSPKFCLSIGETKPSEDQRLSREIDSDGYEKQVKRLSKSVNKYKRMHKSSQKKLKQAEEKAKQEKLKFERIKQIYMERIKVLNRNIKSNKRTLGHLFSYQEMEKNLIPSGIILQMSGEEKSRELKSLENELEIYQEYYKSVSNSMVDEISLDSRPDLYSGIQ